jgi:NADH-quinone oxidoreductase subunit A
MFETFFPILVLFIFALVVVLIMILLPQLLATKTANRRKVSAYECGIVPETDARMQFPVKFYMIAILFIIFDLEIVFFYPWALILRQLKAFALIEMLVFVAILLLGYLYIIKKGALKWE